MTDKEIKKDKYLKKKYGISLSDYHEMLKQQNDSCKICEKNKSHFKRSLAVDHDHKSGEVRGLLCYYCNKRFVGRHTKETVIKLVKYLLPEFILIKKDLTSGMKLAKVKKGKI